MHRHSIYVVIQSIADMAILALSMVGGMLLVTHLDWQKQFSRMWPAVLLGTISIGCTNYIIGLYTRTPTARHNAIKELITVTTQVFVGQSLAILVMVIFAYLNFSTRIGRGIMLAGNGIAFALILAHHLYLRRQEVIDVRERIAYLLLSPADEARARLLGVLHQRQFLVVGVIIGDHVPRQCDYPVLGMYEDLVSVAAEHRLSRVICTTDALNDGRLSGPICTLRYSGVGVTSLLSLCEEIYQCVPIPLVTASWLMSASDSPFMPYITKVKRITDVALATVGLLLLSLPLVVGMILVRFTSAGPIIFRQRRCGRLGREFEVLKLRTMRQDAEAAGAVWSTAGDPRVTWVGRYLRQFRIDEIPQLFNVLRGDMSFVGPRPERPEFVDQLARQIPFYRERMLVLPGITGWAQVRYPYGSTVEDAKRKLEYDLYYMKHMGMLMDLLIVLDTVRTVMRGSLWQTTTTDLSAHLPAAIPGDDAPEEEPPPTVQEVSPHESTVH